MTSRATTMDDDITLGLDDDNTFGTLAARRCVCCDTVLYRDACHGMQMAATGGRCPTLPRMTPYIVIVGGGITCVAQQHSARHIWQQQPLPFTRQSCATHAWLPLRRWTAHARGVRVYTPALRLMLVDLHMQKAFGDISGSTGDICWRPWRFPNGCCIFRHYTRMIDCAMRGGATISYFAACLCCMPFCVAVSFRLS